MTGDEGRDGQSRKASPSREPLTSAPLTGAPLTNVRSDRVRAVRGLASRSARLRAGRFLVEGPQGVREAVRFAAGDVLELYLTADAVSRYPELPEAAAAAGLRWREVSDEVSRALSTDSPGVLAVMERAPDAAAESPEKALASALAARPRLVAVLSQVRDPGNAGAVIRASDAAGGDLVVLTDSSVEVTNPKVVRSTAGSLFHVPVVSGVTIADAVDALRGAGMTVLAADAGGETLDEVPVQAALGDPTAWVFGNEAHGLSEDERSLADRVIAVPIFGRAESLNLATAAAVCLYASAFGQRTSQD